MHPPRAPQLPKSVLLAGVALLLGLITWSPPAQAQEQAQGDILGYATFAHQGTEPRFEKACKYSYKLACFCPWGGRVPGFDTVIGCSIKDQLGAMVAADITCKHLCGPVGQFPGVTGVTIARFPASGNQGVTLQGAGTIFQTSPGSYLGVSPLGADSVGPSQELEYVGQQLTTSTGVAWNWLVPGSEPIVWSDPSSTAAIVQSFRISDGGPPPPVGECFFSVESGCEFDDPLVWGDRLRVCSNESEHDANVVSQTACTALRHEAWVQSLQPWGVYSLGSAGSPTASIIVSTPEGTFMGYLPGSSSPSFVSSDLPTVVSALVQMATNAPIWLAGPMEPYDDPL